jgi:hypothetical protein
MQIGLKSKKMKKCQKEQVYHQCQYLQVDIEIVLNKIIGILTITISPMTFIKMLIQILQREKGN